MAVFDGGFLFVAPQTLPLTHHFLSHSFGHLLFSKSLILQLCFSCIFLKFTLSPSFVHQHVFIPTRKSLWKTLCDGYMKLFYCWLISDTTNSCVCAEMDGWSRFVLESMENPERLIRTWKGTLCFTIKCLGAWQIVGMWCIGNDNALIPLCFLSALVWSMLYPRPTMPL